MSASNTELNTESSTDISKDLGTFAHLLYLLNISFLPIVAFVWLLMRYSAKKEQFSSAAIGHYKQAIGASIIAGILLLMVSLSIILIGGFESPYSWMTLLIYFTCVHSALLLFGVFAWVKASNNKPFSYPLWGRWF